MSASSSDPGDVAGRSSAAGGPTKGPPGPSRGPLPPLHLVTDDDVVADPGFEARARTVLAAGPPVALHLRGPRTPGRRLHDLAVTLLPAAEAAGALLLVNDRVDVVGAAGAHGVHLGRRSLAVADARALLGPDAWIGASVHGAGEARAVLAEAPDEDSYAPALPDFLLVGTLWATASHPGRPGAGPERLRTVEDAVAAALGDGRRATSARPRIPLLGIGGVTPARIPEVRAAGAAGVAVLSGVWAAADPAAAVADYLAAWDGP